MDYSIFPVGGVINNTLPEFEGFPDGFNGDVFEKANPDGSFSARPNFTAEELLTINRDITKELIRIEGIRLIGLQVPEWGDLETIKFILSISNLLTLSNMTPEQDLAKQIYLHAESQFVWCDTASQLEIDNYDPLSGWPS